MSLRSLCSAHVCTIRQLVEGRDALGGSVPVPTNVSTGTPCRFVPQDGSDRINIGKNGVQYGGAFYFVDDPGISEQEATGYEIVYGGLRYEVVSVKNPDRLNRFWKVLVSNKTHAVDTA